MGGLDRCVVTWMVRLGDVVAWVLGLVQWEWSSVLALGSEWVVWLVELLALGWVLVFLVGLSLAVASPLAAGDGHRCLVCNEWACTGACVGW